MEVLLSLYGSHYDRVCVLCHTAIATWLAKSELHEANNYLYTNGNILRHAVQVEGREHMAFLQLEGLFPMPVCVIRALF